MGCRRCGGSGWVEEWEETAGPGWNDVPCPDCQSRDGTEPEAIDEMMKECLQADIDAAWEWHDGEGRGG